VRHLVLGTAGHIDHGKSALVQALTGIDPDRLREEKRRGITIELGFADHQLDDEHVLSFVDVPGHERFVRHMVAGAAGIDAVLLVVAADQGVQPQTREHLDICALLGVRRGVVALSKCDLVDDELTEVVSLELRELLEGTFLEEAPLVPVSAKSGRGLDELRDELRALYDRVEPRSSDGVARLPIDRSFVLHGFGTVVTGTLVSGRIEEGDELELLPGGERARVRGIQVHRHKLPAVEAGRRTAINLQGLDQQEAPRGSTVTRTGALVTTRCIWARLDLLPTAPRQLQRGGPVRFHQGTADHAARLRVLSKIDDATLRVEIHFAEPAVLAPGDRFILRRPAPVDTVAGGVVLDVRPPRAREATDDAFELQALEPAAAVALRLARAGSRGRAPQRLAAELGLTAAQLDAAVTPLTAGGRWFDGECWRAIGEAVEARVAQYHGANPLDAGMAREALRGAIAPEMPQESNRRAASGSRARRWRSPSTASYSVRPNRRWPTASAPPSARRGSTRRSWRRSSPRASVRARRR
jgi:selenocysteine-specific elongation factor